MKKSLIIALDFDGTCVTNDFPKIGRDIGAVPVLKELVEKGHRLILLTNRYDDLLSEAVAWFNDNGIPLFGVNNNPIQARFTKSPKIYADIYIEDRAVGCPVITNNPYISKAPFVDWKEIRSLLEKSKIL